jgi:RHS repeat-associated protein
VKNIEGDILELRGSTNALVAKYIYDGWGKLLEVRDSSGNAITSSTHIANLNVLRYRGYFYDAETKLYYLQSRYYDPQTQRFINPDAYVSTGQGIIGHNMFAYCNNNPANKEDSYGEDAIWIQEGNSAGGFGHSGLLVQDSNGKWFYFYWGPIKEKEKNIPFLILGVQNGAYLIPCDRIKGDLHYTANVVETVLGAFVEYNTNHKKEKKENRAFLITSTYYFSGDYTATYNYCKKISSERNLYRLLNYNCFQITWNAMAESNKAFTKKHYFIPNNHMIEIFYLSDRFVQPYSVSFFASKNHTHSFLSFK